MISVLLYNDWTCLLIQFLFIIIKFFQFNKNNTYHFERLFLFYLLYCYEHNFYNKKLKNRNLEI